MLRHRIPTLLVFSLSFSLGAACADLDDGTELDAIDDDLALGDKADTGALAEGTPDAYTVLQVANHATEQTLVSKVGLGRQAAGAIVATRLGDDGVPGTGDDERFWTLAALDRVAWVGPRAFERLRDWGKRNGYGMPDLYGSYVVHVRPAGSSDVVKFHIVAEMHPTGEFLSELWQSEELVPIDRVSSWADFDRVEISLSSSWPQLVGYPSLLVTNLLLRGAIRSGATLCGSGELTEITGKVSVVSWAALRGAPGADVDSADPFAGCN